MAFKFLALSVLVATLAIGTHGQGLLGNIPSLLNEVLSPVSELLTPVTGILEPVLGPDGVLSGILDNNVLGLVKSLQIVGVLQKIVAIVVGLLQTVLSLLDINNIPPEVHAVFQKIQILLKEIVQVVVELIPKLLLGELSGGAASSVAP